MDGSERRVCECKRCGKRDSGSDVGKPLEILASVRLKHLKVMIRHFGKYAYSFSGEFRYKKTTICRFTEVMCRTSLCLGCNFIYKLPKSGIHLLISQQESEQAYPQKCQSILLNLCARASNSWCITTRRV